MSKAIQLSEPQSEAYWSTATSKAIVAGFGSGKTYIAMLDIFKLLNRYPGIPQGYAAPTYSMIKDIFFPMVEEHCIERGYSYHIHKSDYVITIFGLGKIICRSLSNPDKIVGFEVGDFTIDEMDILPVKQALNAWRKCKARCRKKYPKKRLFNEYGESIGKGRKKNQMGTYTTPEGYKATYKLFVEKPIKNSQLIQMSTYSNQANLPDDYIDELIANYPPQLVKAYIMGKFTNLTSGSVYPNFSRTENDAPGIFAKKREPIMVGMDFNVRKMVGIIHVLRQGNPVACNELVQITDTPAMCTALREVYPHNPIIIYPDASGKNPTSSNASQSDIKILKEAGFYIKAKNSNPAVKDRVNSMNVAFTGQKGYKYFVNVAKCPLYTKTLEQQVYDKNNIPDKDHDTDHPNDAGGYYINYDFGITKPTTTQTPLPM